MLRYAICLIVCAAPALAQDKPELCRITAAIAGSAVAERAGGAARDQAVAAVSGGLEDGQAGYEAAVPHIVDWVYTLPEEQLTGEVATAYEAACLAQ